MRTPFKPRLRQQVLAVFGTGVLLVAVAGCGSSNNPNANGSAQQYGSNQNGPQNRQQVGQRPGADGKVAAVEGSTAQVQSQSAGQVAVTWTSSTTFTKQVAAKLAQIKAGDCVMVTPTQSSSSSGSTALPTAITAASVHITTPVNGSCPPSFRGGPAGGGPQTQQNGSGAQQFQGSPPSGGPSGPPNGGPGNGTRFRGFGAFGKVSAVSANGFTVTTTLPSSSSSPSTTQVSVTVSPSTTYTSTAKGTAADVKVGVCVRADGTADNTGAVTAKTIAITPPVEGQCGGMFFQRDGSGSANSGDSPNSIQVS